MQDASTDAAARGFLQNLDGSGSLLGGALLVDQKGAVVFEWRELHWGHKVPGEALVAAATAAATASSARL